MVVCHGVHGCGSDLCGSDLCGGAAGIERAAPLADVGARTQPAVPMTWMRRHDVRRAGSEHVMRQLAWSREKGAARTGLDRWPTLADRCRPSGD